MTKYMREALQNSYRKNVIIAAAIVLDTGTSVFDIGTNMGYEGRDLEDFIEEVMEYFVEIAEANHEDDTKES